MSIHEMTVSQKSEFLAAFRAKFGFGELTASANADAHAMLSAAAWAWQAARIPSEATKTLAWRVTDAKGKRFTVYNKDLALAISEAGLCVAPMCDVPPEGWECSRNSGHEGPCAAYEVAK